MIKTNSNDLNFIAELIEIDIFSALWNSNHYRILHDLDVYFNNHLNCDIKFKFQRAEISLEKAYVFYKEDKANRGLCVEIEFRTDLDIVKSGIKVNIYW